MKQFVPYLAGISAREISFSRDGQWVVYVTSPDCTLWRSKVMAATGGGSPSFLCGPSVLDCLQTERLWRLKGRCPDLPNACIWSRLTVVVRSLESPAGKQFTNCPSWSPDGNSITIQAGLASDLRNAVYRVDLKTRKAVMLPGSEGLHVPEWSPDGRYVSAATGDDRKLMLFDFQSSQWSELANGNIMLTSFWSRDSKYLYWQDRGTVGEPIFRVRMSNRKRECIATSKQIVFAAGVSYLLAGVAPDGSPVIAIRHEAVDIYALDVDLR